MNRRTPIAPVAWRPPPAPPRDNWRHEPTMPDLRILQVNGLGPEDVLVDGDGQILTGVHGGRVLRLTADGRQIVEVVNTGGRPLGIELLPDGALLVCDAYIGLLRVDPATEAVDVLVDKVDGEQMRFCKSAAVAADGTIYFSDSSQRFGFHEWKADLMEHTGTGRLLCRLPDGAVRVLLDNLQLANGVALTPDEAAVVVAETGNFQLTRYWLSGPRAGTSDVLGTKLPGYPFGISLGDDGLIWVAIASPRHWVLDLLAKRNPLLRKAVWQLPEPVHPKPIPSIWVLAVDPTSGAIVHDLHGPPQYEFAIVTGVREHQGIVYLGSVVTRTLGALDVKPRG